MGEGPPAGGGATRGSRKEGRQRGRKGLSQAAQRSDAGAPACVTPACVLLFLSPGVADGCSLHNSFYLYTYVYTHNICTYTYTKINIVCKINNHRQMIIAYVN